MSGSSGPAAEGGAAALPSEVAASADTRIRRSRRRAAGGRRHLHKAGDHALTDLFLELVLLGFVVTTRALALVALVDERVELLQYPSVRFSAPRSSIWRRSTVERRSKSSE
jgi:hypothetical protein